MIEGSMLEARFNLRGGEVIHYFVTHIGSGNWTAIEMSEQVAQYFLLKFIRNMKTHGYFAVREVVWMMQNLLMAQRARDFVMVQKDAPFSPVILNNLVQLDEAWVSGGDDAFLAKWGEIFHPRWREALPKHELIRMTGGPGDCPDTAFWVHAPDAETRICAEYWYLYYTYGRMYKDWETSSQCLTPADELGREFDVIVIRLPNGDEKPVFF